MTLTVGTHLIIGNGTANNSIEDDKKILCQMFSKLYIPDTVDDELIRRLKLYIDTVKMVSSPSYFFLLLLIPNFTSVVH